MDEVAEKLKEVVKKLEKLTSPKVLDKLQPKPKRLQTLTSVKTPPSK